MKIVQQNIDLLKQKIQDIQSQKWKSADQKYFEVCAYYATMMTVLAKHSDVYALEDLEPVAKIFDEYQDKYFDGILD